MNGMDHLRDVRAEEALLARMMWGAEFVRETAMLSRADFTSAGREAIFVALWSLEKAQAPFDLVVLHDELRRRDQADRCGGPLELARIAELAPSGADVAHYAAIVRRLGRRRAIVETAQNLARRAADLTVPDEDLALDVGAAGAPPPPVGHGIEAAPPRA